MFEVGDLVKVISTTECQGENRELIPIGTICKVAEVENKPEGIDKPYVGIKPLDKNTEYFYLFSEVEKGHLEWVKDAEEPEEIDLTEEFLIQLFNEKADEIEKIFGRRFSFIDFFSTPKHFLDSIKDEAKPVTTITFYPGEIFGDKDGKNEGLFVKPPYFVLEVSNPYDCSMMILPAKKLRENILLSPSIPKVDMDCYSKDSFKQFSEFHTVIINKDDIEKYHALADNATVGWFWSDDLNAFLLMYKKDVELIKINNK